MSGPDEILRWSRSTRSLAVLAGFLAVLGIGLAVALLGVSGWLITASGLVGAGLLGMIELFAPGALIRASAVGRTVARYGERLFGHDAMLRQLATLRVAAFRRLMQWPLPNLERFSNGDLLTRLTRDIDTLDLLLPRWWLPSLAAVGGSLLAIVALAIGAGPLSPAGLVLLVLALGSLMLLSRRAAAAGAGIVDQTARMRREVTTWIDGLAELLTLGRAAERAEDILQRAEVVIERQRHQRRLEAIGIGLLSALGYLAFWAVLVGGLLLVELGRAEAPVAIGLALMMLGLTEAWQATPGGWILRANCRKAAERIAALGREGTNGALPSEGEPPASDSSASSGASLRFRHLAFRWSAASDLLLDDLDLDLQAGERVIVEGVSGSGKTTLGRLAGGEILPERGEARLDGRAMADWPEAERFGRVGRLEQSPLLFRDTVANNLKLADPDAAEARMRAVIQAVDLGEWLEQRPDGLDSWLGEQGSGLSGGQARRLTLARLLLGGSRLLVLDEPMAGLDRATAARVWTGIQPWLDGRTLLVLSHDPIEGGRFDRRWVLENGRLRPK
jgi:ATP-binding cassette subfamily C protein CydC